MSDCLRLDSTFCQKSYRATKNRVTRFKEAYVWLEKEEKIYTTFLIGMTLHLCCGRSLVGDVRVDLDRTLRPDICADIRFLPFRDQSFDTVICDPVWIHSLTYTLGFDLPRIARRRIIVILNNHWFEPHRGSCFELKRIYVIKKLSPAVKLLYIYDKSSFIL